VRTIECLGKNDSTAYNLYCSYYLSGRNEKPLIEGQIIENDETADELREESSV
jgi:hypothetical protein